MSYVNTTIYGANTKAVGYHYTGTTADSIWTTNTKTDIEFFGPYMLDTVNDPANNYLEFVLRYSSGGTDQVSVRVYEGKMQLRKVVSGTPTTVDFNDVDSPAGSAYGLWARCIGSTLQVLRAYEGSGWRVVAEMTGVPTTATTRVYLNTSGDMTAFVNDINYFAHKTTADSFADDFTASTLGGGWTATGSYSVVGNTLNGTNAAGYATVSRANTSADNQLKVSLKKTSSLNSIRLYVRSQDSNNQVWVETWGTAMQIIQRSGGVNTTLASASITTTLNTWYDYHIISDGNRIEVWRGPQGGTTELLLETDAATILGSAAMVLETRLCTASFDNVQFITPDPATVTFEYNAANELTKSTQNAVNTTYTYDAWGRTITKTDGTHTATYLWAFGDKLKQYNSTFPGEEDVAYNYDGVGKRRVKVFNPSAPTDADHVWYRWDAGWNMIGEYAAGTNALTTWDIGALTRHYTTQPGGAKGQALAHADGDPDSAAYKYYATDHLGSPRSTYSQAKAVVAKQAFSPYGMPMLSAGQRMDVGFTGHKWDDESDMFHAPYRYYNPYTSRWMSRDPLGMVAGPNVYSYVTDNPVGFVDPTGEVPHWVIGAAIGIVGALIYQLCTKESLTDINAGLILLAAMGGAALSEAPRVFAALTGAQGLFHFGRVAGLSQLTTRIADILAGAVGGGAIGAFVGGLLSGRNVMQLIWEAITNFADGAVEALRSADSDCEKETILPCGTLLRYFGYD